MENKLGEIKQNFTNSSALYGAIHYLGAGRTHFEQRDDINASDDIKWLIQTVEEQQQEIEALKECVNNAANDVLTRIDEIEQLNIPKSIEEWGEEDGDCLWWFFPIVEPPYCGTPLDSDFPDYVTHFTKFLVPEGE